MENRSRIELEEHWRQRLQTAQQNYRAAADESNAAMRIFQEGGLPAPDGSEGFNRALRNERFTRQEYIRVLRVFTDLIVHGKVPTEE